ncbi:DNA mismatch repair protein [Aspergillus sclerotialis]|uniref:DNA mismatch repair protein n=1 Tax=Aspergillus sclerotialis TaxID=2070753 RepID=A0A3A2ZW53_9EURO|nr:DNA mismatch repair protein [Aspergillus sclerotialis]
MSSNDGRIQPLPSDVVAKIKSSTSITHLNGVVVELVKNSLDADAHSISVTVDFQRGSCIVEDDGEGIPAAEFEPNGGLGKAHHTSKLQPSRDQYGQKGLFLASLASLSLLTITSHRIHQQNTSTIVLHHSRAVSRLIPAPVHQRLKSSRHGTSVTVNDLFGNMPVRVRSRALTLQKPEELEREWDNLKYLLVSMMLANNSLKKLVLLDTGRNRKLTIRLQPESLLASNAGQGIDPEVQRINSIITQANLISHHNADCWNTVSASVPNMSIHAAISLVPIPTKKVQFISLGISPLFVHNTNVLYSEINRLFSLSDFGTLNRASECLTETQTRGSAAHCDEQDSMAAKGPTRAIDRCPMFYIRINTDTPQKLYNDGIDFAPESDKSIQRLIDVLATMVNEFLKQHNLRPRATKRQTKVSHVLEDSNVSPSEFEKSKCSIREGCPDVSALSTEETLNEQLKIPSFRKTTRSYPDQNFGNWSRIKAARGTPANARNATLPRKSDLGSKKELLSQPSKISYQDSEDIRSPIQNIPSVLPDASRERVCRDPSRRTDIDQADEAQPQSGDEAFENSVDKMIPWVDPYTGKSHLINARTGQSMGLKPRPSSALAYDRPRSTGTVQNVQPLENKKRPSSATPRMQNLWLESLLKKWDNPAFSRAEKAITSINAVMSHENSCSINDCDRLGEVRSLEAAGYAKFRGKLRKHHLELTEVIAQVDRKFIFAKMKATPADDTESRDSDTILALIDQHAADERCRVEKLFEGLFLNSKAGLDQGIDIRSFQLDPIVFEIKLAEVPLFERYLEHFSSWGIHYRINHEPGSSVGIGAIYALPTLIAERCRIEPNLAIDLIRSEIWKREENGKGPSHSIISGDDRNSQIQDNESPSISLDESDSGTRHSWVERLGGCPQGIIEMLNSRACRSAIMFNDILTLGECQSIITRLAQCVFPFQCAHGRPSMIPILDLRSVGKEGDNTPLELASDSILFQSLGQNGEHDAGYVETFRSWRDTLG